MVKYQINDPKNLTQKELKELLAYDPFSGHFYWQQDRNQFIRKGQRAGQVNEEGYIRIKVKGRKTYAHRLAWLYVYGSWPKGEIDHIDVNPSNNSLNNLRVVSRSLNTVRQTQKSNKTSGLPVGITLHKGTGKYWVRFRKESLGLYTDLNEAVEIRNKKLDEYVKEGLREYNEQQRT